MWKVSFDTPDDRLQEHVDRLEQALVPECVAITWTETPNRDKSGRETRLVEAFYLVPPTADELGALLPWLAPDAYIVEHIPDIDWVSESQKNFPPLRAGRFFVSDRARADERLPGDSSIFVDAGAAFGTGHHGSTAGCLLAIDRLAKRVRPRTVLDLGCGSGILSIAAAKVWRTSVLASDLDPVAVDVTAGNCRYNGAAAFVQTVQANGFRHRHITDRKPFDLILANILARPLCQMASSFGSHLDRRGYVVLSGLAHHQEAQVLSAFRSASLSLDQRIRLDGWSTLILRRSRR